MANFDEKKIEKIIHYGFKDKELLKLAFTHSSYANQNGKTSNERLEFLGDSILNFLVAEDLYNKFDVEEGKMSKWRAKMVNSDNLANIITNLKLEDFMLLGKSFGKSAISQSMKENLFECLVGAIYLDSSMDKAKRFVFRFINTAVSVKKKDLDFKTQLQEKVQQVKGASLVYFTYALPHDPDTYCAEVYINDIFVARSTAQSKKQAQIDCAKVALSDPDKLEKFLK